ncbi:MAG: hypothetical protein ACI36W_02535 [Coriobacteriales bacterium]
MPQVEYCLDLRELISIDELSQTHATGQPPARELLSALAPQGCQRIYLGSSFCPQALIGARTFNEQLIAAARECGLHITLSLPIPSQRWLAPLQQEALDLLQLGEDVIDELAANDFGMLEWACSLSVERAGSGPLPFGVVLGRLLNKDTRDPRDPHYPWQPAAPKIIQRGPQRESYLDRLLTTFSYWNIQLQEYRCPLAGLELDPFCEQLFLHEMPPQLIAALNGPLCCMSAGQICEYASLGLREEHMFRPNAPCAHQCQGTCVRYRGASGVEFAKLGRAVFFQPQWQCMPRGVQLYRQLLSPLGEVRR